MKLTNDRAAELKEDFPIFRRKIHTQPLCYLDNAASTQKPQAVINAIKDFYEHSYANIHRGVYQLSQEATEQYEDAHDAVGKLIGAGENEIAFTRNATEAINLLSHTIKPLVEGSTILLTEMEHHANLVPWQQLAKKEGMKLSFIRMREDFTLDYGDAEQKLADDCAILSVSHISNALGTINDVKRLVGLAKKNGALAIVDAAKSAPHGAINVKEIGCDFMAFSGHKMLGPTGIGALYGRHELLEQMEPFQTGGDMISSVTYESAQWNDVPQKFEAGTPHIAGGIGLAKAAEYLQNIGPESISAWEKELLKHTLESISSALEKGDIRLFNPGHKHSAGILSLNLAGIHAHDLASLMDDMGICIRGGHHCAMPLMNKLGVAGTARASFYLYNTTDDADRFVAGLKKAKEMFN